MLVKWTGHVARMKELKSAYEIFVGEPEGLEHSEDLGTDEGRI
jgi:hypothetical protein